jgi:hypothetical protein
LDPPKPPKLGAGKEGQQQGAVELSIKTPKSDLETKDKEEHGDKANAEDDDDDGKDVTDRKKLVFETVKVGASLH